MFLLILIILLIVLLLFRNINNREGFDSDELNQYIPQEWSPLWVGKGSSDCYNEPLDKCMTNTNCGICKYNDTVKCVPGDINGPFFDSKCQDYIYTNNYDRHLFGEKVTTRTSPWNTFYSHYEVYYPSPVARSAL